MSLRRVVLVLALTIPAHAGFALDPSIGVEQYVRTSWNADTGLPQNSVFGITQARDGFMWIATQEGFVRFDGAEFVTYDKRNTPDITHFVETAVATRDGSVFIGTLGGGIIRLRDESLEVITEKSGLPSNDVFALLQAADGTLWVGTRNGLARLSQGNVTRLPADRLPNAQIVEIAEDSTGRLWIATANGLTSMAGGEVNRYDTSHGLPNSAILALAPGRDGVMWIGTEEGLYSYRTGAFEKHRAAQLANLPITAVHEDRSGTLWVGAYGPGFGRVRGDRVEFASGNVGAVTTFYEDAEGNLWVGHYRGLERLSNGLIVTFAKTEGLLDDDVKSVSGDATGAWVATQGGVENIVTRQRLTKRDGLSSSNALTTLSARDGSLWIGTRDAGLNHVVGNRVTQYGEAEGLPGARVLVLFEDHRGVLWVGTIAGLTRIVNGRVNREGLPPALETASISAIAESRDGSIWVGTHDNGVTRIGAHSVVTYAKRNGLSEDLVLSLYEDASGSMWIGTGVGGLNRYRDGKISTITSSHGLQDDSAFAIVEDNFGNLWMSSNKGIFRASLAELNAVADGKKSSLQSVIYGRTDGMKSRECNGGMQPVTWKAPDGKLWFATTGGVASIDPAEALRGRAVAPVLIGTIFVDGEKLIEGTPVPAGHRSVEIRYTAPTFKTPDKLRFQYRLEGFDPRWVDAGTRRIAYYTNVPPGPRNFEVRALNGEGGISAVATTALEFEPFIYQRPAFWVFVAIVLLTLAWSTHQYRIRLIRASAERFKLLFDRNLAGVVRARVDGLILDCNQAGLRILGMQSLDQLNRRSIFDAYTNPADADNLVRKLHEDGAVSGLETSLQRPDGTPIWVLQNVNLAQNQGQEIIEATLIDITDRKRAEEQIRYQAYHDSLTALPNRTLFKEQLSLAVAHAERRGRQVAVLFLDLDRFKLINDTLGHTIGDHLLQGMSDRLKSCIRDEDSVARVGGDEFTVLLADLRRPADAMVVARKVLDIVARPVTVDGHELYVTCSIGIAMSPADGVDAETLLKNADNALYRAKEAGKNNYQLCTPSMTQLAAERLALENALRQAIDRDEFRILYQPQYDLSTRRIIAVEALLRWERPGFGIVGPAQFIAAAEESRLIVPMGEWVLDTAALDAQNWNGDAPIRIAVNVSPAQFRQKHLVRAIRTALQEHSLDPTRLEVEITESTAMQNPTVTAEILEELKELGVSIVIDDFGIGHSSLNYLKRFPIDGLKVDRTFVQDLTTDASDAGIVAAVIAMAHALNLRVTAEGVETEEQLRFLENHGCSSIQGYLVGRPMPASEITEQLRAGVTLSPTKFIRSVS